MGGKLLPLLPFFFRHNMKIAMREVPSMERTTVEKYAKKYKKLLEKVTIIHFVLSYNKRKWWLAEYSFNNTPKGYAVFTEGDSSVNEKEIALDHIGSFIRTCIGIQSIVHPRIAVTEEINNTLNKMNDILNLWVKSEEEIKLKDQFNEFTDFILWCQEKTNEYNNEFSKIAKKIDENHLFTVEQREQLVLIGSKLDLIIYLQVKSQYDQLHKNRELLSHLKNHRNNLDKKDYYYIVTNLKKYCDSNAQKDFEKSLFNEDELIWKDVIATIDSFERLKESSHQKYKNIDKRKLQEMVRLLRN